MGVAGDNFSGRLLAEPAVQIIEARRAANLICGYAMHGHTIRIKIVLRIDQQHFGRNFLAVLKGNDANLAYAAHPD
jgi:hypothetical protein